MATVRETSLKIVAVASINILLFGVNYILCFNDFKIILLKPKNHEATHRSDLEGTANGTYSRVVLIPEYLGNIWELMLNVSN